MRGCVVFKELADRVLDDVVDDILGRVMDAAGFPDFGLFFDLGLMAGSETDDLAEELFVDVAEYVRHRLTAHG